MEAPRVDWHPRGAGAGRYVTGLPVGEQRCAYKHATHRSVGKTETSKYDPERGPVHGLASKGVARMTAPVIATLLLVATTTILALAASPPARDALTEAIPAPDSGAWIYAYTTDANQIRLMLKTGGPYRADIVQVLTLTPDGMHYTSRAQTPWVAGQGLDLPCTQPGRHHITVTIGRSVAFDESLLCHEHYTHPATSPNAHEEHDWRAQAGQCDKLIHNDLLEACL